MIELDDYRRAFGSLPPGAAEAEVNAEEHRISLVAIRGGAVTGTDQSESRALYLRVSGDKTGYLYTQDLDDPASEALREAFENGRYSENPFPDEMRRGASAVSLDLGGREAESDLGRLGEAGIELDRAIRASAPGLEGLSLSLRAETIGLRTINTHGLDVGFERPLYIAEATAVAGRGGGQYSASYNRTASDLADFSAEDFGVELLDILESQYDPKPFRAGRYRAVLRNNVVYNILSTAWQLFSGRRYLDGSSLFSDRLGEIVASPCLSIRDYPARPDSGFDLPCDCEGSPGALVDIVKDGVFAGLMHNLGTARALGAEPTGNAGRRPLLSGSIPTTIQVTPRNFCVEPGRALAGELLEHLGEGVFVTGSFDVFHSINIASGSFSIPCRGLVVTGGRKTAATGPFVLSGNLKDLLAGVEEVGRDFYLGTMLALDNYGIGACSLRVGELSFSGA
jgi:PmbA protein